VVFKYRAQLLARVQTQKSRAKKVYVYKIHPSKKKNIFLAGILCFSWFKQKKIVIKIAFQIMGWSSDSKKMKNENKYTCFGRQQDCAC
jgi:hypothetical protein